MFSLKIYNDFRSCGKRAKTLKLAELGRAYWGATPVSYTPLSQTKFGKRFVIQSFVGLDPEEKEKTRILKTRKLVLKTRKLDNNYWGAKPVSYTPLS